MDPITITIAALVAWFSCNGSDHATTKEDSGIQPQRDGGLPSHDLVSHDAPVAQDSYSLADARRLPDAAHDASPDAAPDAGPPRILRPDVNIHPTSRLAIFAADFSSRPPSGLLTSLNLGTLTLSPTPSMITSTDVILRSHSTNLFVIDRSAASIGVYDNRFANLRTISVDPYTNPQDIVVLSTGDKAYVTRLDAQSGTTDRDDLWILDPTTGERLGSGGLNFIDYTTADSDRLARAGQMVLVGANLYVVLQDLDSGYHVDTNGKVVVVDTTTDTVITSIPLSGRNPADITYSEALNKIFVTDTGVYNAKFRIDTSTPYGGIETIDPVTNSSEGIQIDDADLGGGVSEIRLASADLGYVMTDSRKIASFNPSTGAVLDTMVYASPGSYLPDFTIDASGELIVAEMGSGVPGEDGIAIPPARPIAVGAPPSSITFMTEE